MRGPPTLVALAAVLGAMSGSAQERPRVVVLSTADAPLILDAVQVDQGALVFTARNVGVKKVTAYAASVYWFPPAGQRHGFTTQEQHPLASLGGGDVHQTVMPLPLTDPRATFGPETTLIVALRGVTFDDGTSWNDDAINARVSEKARELKLP
jgi:hypothetical protein